MKRRITLDSNGRFVSKRRRTRYDATALRQRYEDVEIARNITIEKLSLCKRGCKRTFQDDHNEFVARRVLRRD